MPGKLKYFAKKPKSMAKSDWKGTGRYYKREGGWTKYSPTRDAKVKGRQSPSLRVWRKYPHAYDRPGKRT